jgi:integration host factor subunit alpha
MTKAEIIDSVHDKVGGFSRKESAEVVDAVFATMKDSLSSGDKVKISGFGNFVVRSKKERVGRNPQTGQPIPICARHVLTFKPSQVLKNILNPSRTPSSVHGDKAEPKAAKSAGF